MWSFFSKTDKQLLLPITFSEWLQAIFDSFGFIIVIVIETIITDRISQYYT